jgi:uncharacterized protein DUF5990
VTGNIFAGTQISVRRDTVSTPRPGPVPADTGIVQIRIEGTDLPGNSCGPSPERPAGHAGIHVGIHVGVQRQAKPAELLDVTPGDAPAATWTLDAVVTAKPEGGVDLKGPYIQGPPGGRFIYLNWGTVDDSGEFTMFRRAKLWLEAVPPEVLADAADRGVLVGRLGLVDPKGNPICASVRPPLIAWSAATE